MKQVWLIFLTLNLFSFASAFAAPMKLISATDAHEILGIPQTSSVKDALAAYRKLMMKYHPDRHAGAGQTEQSIAEENMKRCKAAYEAIESRDVSKMAFFKGTLNGQRSTTSFEFNFDDFFNDLFKTGGPADSSWHFSDDDKNHDEPSESEDAPSRTDLQTRAKTFFDNQILTVYENETGLIMELPGGAFYWLGRDSVVVYPLIFSWNYSSGKQGARGGGYIDLKQALFDARLPGGYTSFEIRNRETLTVGELSFRRTHFIRPNRLNEELAAKGARLFAKTTDLSPLEMNIWNYFIYQNESETIFVALTEKARTEADPSPISARVFVGQKGAMKELAARTNPATRDIIVPERGWTLITSESKSTPHYDVSSGLFMGTLNTGSSLEIWHQGSKFNVPSVDPQFLSGFSLALWLGKFITPPLMMRTPLDKLFGYQIHIAPAYQIEMAFRRPPPVSRSATAVDLQASTAAERAAHEHAKRVRRMELIEEIRKDLPILAPKLELPKDDPVRRLVEIFAMENADFKKLQELTQTHIASKPYVEALHSLVYDVTDFNRIRHLMPLYELLSKHFLTEHDFNALGVLGLTLLNHSAHRDDPELAPILRRIIDSGNQVVRMLMWRHFGSESNMLTWAKNAPCDDIFRSGSSR